MFKDLDPILHSQIRLAIMSILVGVKSADFNYLLNNISTTKGNLSFQLTKLKEVGYIKIKKTFKGNYPHTSCSATNKGLDAYQEYINSISDYFKTFKNKKNEE